MRQEGLPPDHITAYERAVCYYTLPRIIFPVAYGVIVVYATLLFFAVAFMLIGVLIPDMDWVRNGSKAIIVLVVGGLGLFMGRALVNDVRLRRALASARGVPEPGSLSDSGEEDLPDPFADHLLLKRPIRVPGTLFSCTEDDATIHYFVEHDTRGFGLTTFLSQEWWRIKTAQDKEVCTIRTTRGSGSFLLANLPEQLTITRNGEEIGHLHTRFSFIVPGTQIHLSGNDGAGYLIRNRGIYHAGRLIGRIYQLRSSCYLDIEEKHFNEGILAWFVVDS